MPLQRHFLGWDRPGLISVVDYLTQRFLREDTIDLKGVTVVMPVRRALLRLEELLLERAERDGKCLLPPRTATVGRLADLLCPDGQGETPPLARWVAWIEAIRRLGSRVLAPVLPHPPSDEDSPALLHLAKMFDDLNTEMGGGGRTFADAAAVLREMGRENEAERMNVLERLRIDYLRRLAAVGLTDPQESRRQALREKGCRAPGSIVLLASDLTSQQREMIGQVRDDVTILIFAPQSMSDRFDELGVVNGSWNEAPIPIDDAQWETFDSPSEQAMGVVRALASLAGHYTVEEVGVGVPDASIKPFLLQWMREWGWPTRDTTGQPVQHSSFYRFLQAVLAFITQRGFSDLAALVRHPDIESWLHTRIPRDPSEGIEDWLTLMDRYYSDHLQGRLAGDWLGDPLRARRMKQIHDAVHELVQPLLCEPLPLSGWARPIAQLFDTLHFARSVTGEGEDQHEAAESVREALETLASIHEDLGAPTTADVAIRFLLQALEDSRFTAEPNTPAVELLGWLELALDDAPALIVTGFNEGGVPSSIHGDLFLPDSLRTRLGLTDNAHRYARDAYLLSAILASRKHVRLFSGRATYVGDPLTPSRLVFACNPETQARRVRRFYKPSEEALHLPTRLRPAARSSILVPPKLPDDHPALTRLSVTAFRDYLVCPYRFYLRHVLKLERLDDAALELDGRSFGILAHRILDKFGESEWADSTDSEGIREYLDRQLNASARAVFGQDPPPAVRVQVEQLRQRLHRFVPQQVEHRRGGWRIVHTELDFHNRPVPFVVDGKPIELVGRIDRVERNEAGDLAVLDYKLSREAHDPEKSHVKGGEWVDLQLPLYWWLMRYANPRSKINLGYILLPEDPADSGFHVTDWSEAVLQEAIEVARGVVRSIRAGEFEATQDLVRFDEFADICGVRHLESLVQEQGGED